MLRNVARRGSSFFLPRESNFRSAAYSDKPPPPGDDDEKYWTTEPEMESPISRACRVMGQQFRDIKQKTFFWKEPKAFRDEWQPDSTHFPSHVDVVIVGGGAMGTATAFWLKKIGGETLNVIVIEKDPTYSKASTVLSVGGLRQQFSMEENVEMSLYGAEFIRNAQRILGITGEPPVDLHFHPFGYLYLATENGAQTLEENSRLQNRMGAKNILLTPDKIKERFPYMNTDDLALGCLGLEKEGWFDPWSLLFAMKKKALSLGVEYVTGEVKGFTFHSTTDIVEEGVGPESYTGVNHLLVKTADGEKRMVEFALCVIAAGASSGEVAKMAKIGKGNGVLSVPLPCEPRKRYVYCFHAPDGPLLNTPMVVDPSGSYFRREGLANQYIAGRSPENMDEEPSISNLDVDEDWFHNKIWPELCNRVPAFNNLKLQTSWAGYYDHNYFDENGIVGHHPLNSNLLFATGFSGHGIQQAPAVGRAVAELILHSGFRTIDLTRLGFDRFVSLERMIERNII